MTTTNGPSDQAIVAATTRGERWPSYSTAVLDIVSAAHDPSLGLDRSVCLRDVVEALDATYSPREFHGSPAAFIEREFGGVR